MSPRPKGLRIVVAKYVAPALVAVGLLVMGAPVAAQSGSMAAADPGLTSGPSFRDMLSLRAVGGPAISPDGGSVAYALRVPDWGQNRSVAELWITAGDGAPVRIATEADGYRGSVRWTPDGRWLAYRASGDTPALTLLSPDGGSTRTVELGVRGAGAFRFSPDGGTVAVLAREALSERARREQELYGPFDFRDEESRRTQIWVTSVTGDAPPRQLTNGSFTVTELAWSPDGTEIAFVHQPDPGRNSWWKADLSVVEVASGRTRPLVSEAGPDRRPMWSPDGRSVAFLSTLSDSITNLPMELTVVPAHGGRLRVLTEDLATEPNPVAWTDDGIWITALRGVQSHLFRVDATDASIAQVSEEPLLIGQTSVSADGSTAAFSAQTPTRLGEIYRSGLTSFEPRPLTDMTAQVDGWELGSREVVSWTGPGGVPIEGILHKPDGYDPGRRYPLLVVVHGGPRSVSRPALTLTSSGVYPITHFLRKGALVLQPNYRGSTGWGGEFRQLHQRGVGWGDAGDVEAGVAHLVAESTLR